MDYTQMNIVDEYRNSEKCRKAVTRFLERRGCTVLDELEEGYLHVVFKDEGELVFAACNVGHGQFIDTDFDKLRPAFESQAIKWLASNNNIVGDCRIRFDCISLAIASEESAILRHHMNVLNALEEGEEKNA